MIAEIIVACSGTLVPLGGGCAFVWGKVEGRFKAIETRLERTSSQLEKCKKRDQASRSLMSDMIFGMQMLADEVGPSNPASPALIYVRRLLVRVHSLVDDTNDADDDGADAA